MFNDTILPKRKDEHLDINKSQRVDSDLATGFKKLRLRHLALPEIDFSTIDTHLEVLGIPLRAPLLISSMTGGTVRGAEINRRLATAAEHFGIAMGVGSQRAAIEDPALAWTFDVRKHAPTTLLFANLGAVQLNYGYGISECRRAVEMAGANALYLHLNPLQEALQPEGDYNFSGLLPKIERLCREIEVPVFAKEVGWGISADLARQLVSAGVRGIDVAGAGGTSWSQVEMYRQADPMSARVSGAFSAWGIPTAQALQDLQKASLKTIVFSSGGVRSGLDILKSLALGATLAGIARPFFLAADEGSESLHGLIHSILQELRVAMFSCGVRTLPEINAKLLDMGEREC